MKKLFLFLGFLSVAVMIFLFNTNSTNLTKEVQSKNNLKTKSEKIIKLKMAHNLPINSALHEASVLFAKKVKEKTYDQVQIEIFPSQRLGNDHQMVELARAGKIDILLTPTAKMSLSVPSMQYADLPFLFPTRKDAYLLLDGKPGQMILNDLSSIDLVGVSFFENGFKHFTGNVPLLSPNDFKDKKIRVMKSRIIMEQFKALGAKPVAIDFHATKKALKDRVVDGQENPLVAIVNMGFHEVQSDLTISEHAYLPYVFTISKKTLSKLPIEIGDILIQTGKEVTAWERLETQKRETEFLDTIRKAGVNIHVLTKEQKEKFAQATKNIVNMYEDIIGSHIISKTQELLYKKYKDENSIVIGINADISMGTKGAGLAIKRGAELAVDEINSQGGLLGKRVVLIAKDHKSISTQGIQNVQKFIKNSDVKAIIGGKHSPIISSEISYIQEAKIPYIIPWAASSNVTDNGYEDNYIFRVSLNDKYAIKFLVEQTLKNNNNPAIVVENSIWGRGAYKHIKKYMTIKGLPVPEAIIINRGDNDYENIIQSIKDQNADSILMVMDATEGTKFVKSIGKNSINLPIVSHWGIVGGDFFKINKKYLKKIDLKFIQTFSFFKNKNSVAKKLGLKYLKKYGKDSLKQIASPTGVAQAYDSMKLLAQAIKKANSFDRIKIKEALETITFYKGAVKTYNNPFDIKDHDALDEKDFFMARYNEDGSIIPDKK